MFSRLFTVLPLAALVAVAAAAPKARDAQCDVSKQACCNTDQLADGKSYDFSGTLGSALSGTGAAAGVTCTPFANGGQCSQQTVCCENNTFNGVVIVACSPISFIS